MNKPKNESLVYGIILGLIIIGGVSYGGYRFYVLAKEDQATKTELATKTADYESRISGLLADKANLTLSLETEKNINDQFESQIQQISGTVGSLDKLSKIDPELLKKYSKVFFLSENYVPATLTNIDSPFVAPGVKAQLFQAQAWPFLKNLLSNAQASGLNLRVDSAFRSFDTQSNLKASYKVTYGAGTANSFSADQGYSEHQLGTAVDFTTILEGTNLDVSFEKTPEFTWLTQNAYKYGFVLSYPKDNTYYQYEPWHWRFVGIKLAQTLHDNGKYFYDLDQRQIDSYLINLFDPS